MYISLSNNALCICLVSFCADDDQSNCPTELDRSETDLMNRTTPLAIGARTVPALGKHWKSICSMRLQIERNHHTVHRSNSTATSNTPNTSERTIRILKSIQHRIDVHCMVHLTDAGIT